MRIVFMGTPNFAAASLKALIEAGFDVAAVFTQPDKPKNRGMKLAFSPVKELALENSIPVYQPQTLRDGKAAALLREIEPDALAVVAYGKILPDELLSIPKLGAVNVHASLLPKYRGAAPIQWAVLNGDKTTGVSTMYLAHDMDTGDIIYSEETEIGEFETSGELFERLMSMGAKLLCRTLRDIETGAAPRTKQDETKASYVKMLDKSLSPIDWSRTPREIVKHICGLQPWPTATAELDGTVFKIYAAEYTGQKSDKPAGSVVSAGKAGIELTCGNGETLMITELQAPGKKRMRASDYLLGHKIKVN